jgi:hypothetical protein
MAAAQQGVPAQDDSSILEPLRQGQPADTSRELPGEAKKLTQYMAALFGKD